MIFHRSTDKPASSLENIAIAGTVAVVSVMLLTGCAAQKKSDVSMSDTSTSGVITRTVARVKIMYAAQDIEKGKTISHRDLEEREIWQSKLPPDAITDSSLVVGKVAKYDVGAGQLISIQDLGETKALDVVKIILSKEDTEKLNKKAAENHLTSAELAKSWVLEHLKK